MTDYTQDSFSGRALVELGQQDPDVLVDGQMLAFVSDRLTQTLEGLEQEGMTDWDITGVIPGGRFNALLTLFAGVLSSSYGVAAQRNPRTGRSVMEEQGRRQLRGLVQGEYITPDQERVGNY